MSMSMSRMFVRRSMLMVMLSALVWCTFGVAACNPEKPGTEDAKGEKSTTPDASSPETTADAGADETKPPTDTPPTSGNWPPPAGHVALAFSVDDSANKTYKAKQLRWNGSFVFDDKTNTVTYASAWQPTDGPFPPLYDDGPIDKGGHEPLGATAGDNIHGVVVFLKPDAASDLEFEFGLINEDDHWLWEGPNGLAVVKKDAKPGDVITAKTFKIAPHGSIDIKIALDLSKLPKEFAIDDIKNAPPIFLKGNMSNWSHVQVQDQGKRGDDKAGDGILTYVQSQVLDYSPHFGRLAFERHVQFVFQFNSITGREYKDIDDKAIADGVTAWADCNGDGKFTDDEKQTVIFEKDSRGAVQNTTIVVCEGKEPPCTKADCAQARCKDAEICKGGCTKDSDCNADEMCDSGACKPKPKACTKSDCATTACKDDPVCKCTLDTDCNAGETCNTGSGQCEAQQKCTKDADCPPENTCDTATGRCLAKTCTLQDCQDAHCKNDPVCNDPSLGPLLYFVVPGAGPLAGGTEVTITGERFAQGVKIQIDGKDCTDVKLATPERLTCKTPSSSNKSAVDVVAINPDGRRNTYPQGYRYDDSAGTRPQITKLTPERGDVGGGDVVTIEGRNFASGVKVKFDQTDATDVKFVSATEITCKSPARGSGKVAVTVTNPDGFADTLLDGFEFFEKNPKPDWTRQVWPPTLAGLAGAPLGPVYCQVYDAAYNTKAQGAASNVRVEVGYGTKGSDVTTWPANQWAAATFHKDVGNNDEYQGKITFTAAGSYNYGCRVSLDGGTNWTYADHDTAGSNNGFSPSDAGVATITDASNLSISAVEPAWGLAVGGAKVIVRGGGFATGATVSFGSKAGTQVTIISKTAIEVVVPANSAGTVDVTVSLQGKSQTKTKAFTFTATGGTVDWCKVQFPNKIPDAGNSVPDATAGNASPAIYGVVYKKGVTDKPGKGVGIVAHVGYGPVGTDPGKDNGWRWFAATFNTDKPGPGNPTSNDEYQGNLVPTAAGSFDFAYRFSNDGVTFHHCDVDGNDSNVAYRTGKAGKITVK